MPALDRVGLLDPLLRPFIRTDLGDSVARRSVPTGRFGRDRACLPCLEPPRDRAVRQRHDEPRTTPPNDPASQRNQRRHDAFHPSNPFGRLEKDFSLTRSVEQGSGGANHRTRGRSSFVGLLTRNDTSSGTPHDDAPPRRPRLSFTRLRALVRDLFAPAFGASSSRCSGGSTYDPSLARSASVLPAFPSSVALTRDA